jgi:hypothetical protein
MSRTALQVEAGTRLVWLIATTLLGAGCQFGLDAAAPARAELGKAEFACFVQPVLTRDCSPLLCHGDGRRFLRLYAPNRLRHGGTERERAKPIRLQELQANYVAARAMTDRSTPAQSLLLKKPLDQTLDGFFHGGATKFGQGDVYAGRDDAEMNELRKLDQWVHGESIAKNPVQSQNCLRWLAQLACDEGGDDGLAEVRRWLSAPNDMAADTAQSGDAGVLGATCEPPADASAP